MKTLLKANTDRSTLVMPKLQILTYPDTFLAQPTKPLATIDGRVQKLIDAMAETMYQAPGVGLASIQVGWDESLLIYDTAPRAEGRSLHVVSTPASSRAKARWSPRTKAA